MSKIALKPNDSGTGTFTLEAPNSNTNRTLSLPDEAGTVLTNVSDIESQVKTATNATGSAPVYACRAWVNFDGTGTVAIRASGNVSSITDNGTGRYTVNLTTAMPDTDYAVTLGAGSSAVSQVNFNLGARDDSQGFQPQFTTSSFRISSYNFSTSYLDFENYHAAIFR